MPGLLQLVLLVSLCSIPAHATQWFVEDPLQQEAQRSDNDVRRDILVNLAAQPELKGLAITVKVERHRVTLSGRLHTTAERDLAIGIAHSYAEGRQIIDDFEIIP